MKKNITINLFGQIYNIDEDAYELLNNYEEALRQYFRSRKRVSRLPTTSSRALPNSLPN